MLLIFHLIQRLVLRDPVPNCPTCTTTDLPATPSIQLLKDGTYVDSTSSRVSVVILLNYNFTVTNTKRYFN
jgi:hypothetical protein